MLVQTLVQELRQAGSPDKAKLSQRFFKTRKGEYGEGDVFLGITVPTVRVIAKRYASQLSLQDIDQLIRYKEHEIRLTALLVLTYQYPKATHSEQQKLYEFYRAHTKWINNWDLVDVSAPHIIGAYLQGKDVDELFALAKSTSLWEKRIAIVATLAFIRNKEYTVTLALTTILMHDTHDLIHKACGWMLREVGKYCGHDILRDFLDKYAHVMPRTMLRYALEHFTPDIRKHYMK